MFVPGTPFTQHQVRRQFDRAITDRAADRAWALAARLDPIGLGRALTLTLLLGRAGDDRFRRCALRFLVRFIVEVEPPLLSLKKVVDALDVVDRAHLMPELQDGAGGALEDLARQLHEREGGRVGG